MTFTAIAPHPCPRCGVSTIQIDLCQFCQWERNRALSAVHDAVEKLETAGFADLAARMREIETELRHR